MIDLSSVVSGNLLTESYTIERSTGVLGRGGVTKVTTTIAGFGVVSVASDQDLLMLPEGDRVTGAMVFHSEAQIYETQLDGGTQYMSDVVLWNGYRYRIISVAPYPNRRYWRALGVRMAGE